MKADYVNPFFMSTKEVFRLMLGLDVIRGDLRILEDMVPSKEANALLGVTGDLQGSVLFSYPREMALEMVRIMSGMDVHEIDSFVSSALGEVANIIGGNAVTKLTESRLTCDIVPPQVFVGEYKSLSMATGKALLIPLRTSIGEFDMTVFLKENTK
jgi:chemotaxis protein CheX